MALTVLYGWPAPLAHPLHFSVIVSLTHSISPTLVFSLTVPPKSQPCLYLATLCLLLSWFQKHVPAVPVTSFLTFFRSALILPPQRRFFQPPYLHQEPQAHLFSLLLNTLLYHSILVFFIHHHLITINLLVWLSLIHLLTSEY